MNQPNTIYQVSDLVDQMRRLMEASYPQIWIEGELSSLSAPASGHLYFSLKDEHSQLRCAMFKNRAAISRYRPKAGDLVRVRARISVYSARGDLQCIVQHIEEAGEGLLQRRFEELKTKLDQAGLFNLAHKQALPGFAKHIGLITSPSGAAVKDVLSTLKRRCPGIPVTIYPAVVQGEDAAAALVSAIADAIQHQRCDVLILARGGGSLEDLWCFNDEALANAIFHCPIPIVSGIGHEVDFTIADLVADQRAPTPTAAAEMLSPDTVQLSKQLRNMAVRLPLNVKRTQNRLAQNVDVSFRQLSHPRQQLKQNRERLQNKSRQLQRSTLQQLSRVRTEIGQTQHRLKSLSPHNRIEQHKKQSSSLTKRLVSAQRQRIKTDQQHYQIIASTLHAVSPLATLDRGFSIARDKNDAILRRATQSAIDDEISLQLKSGTLQCTVTDVQD